MLILCYGITKSGSTLAFELIKGMLESAGHAQVRLGDGPVNPGHRVNYVQPIDRKRLNALLDAVGERWIAVKTHAGFGEPMFAYMEKLQKARRIQIVASYRDPRDICLSMMDAGLRSREQGKKEFSEITDVASAVPKVFEQIEKFRKWAAVSNALRIDYDDIAFSPDQVIDRIESSLGISCDRDAAKRYAFEEAFTQRNKAVRNRADEELTAEQNAALKETFATFLAEVCQSRDDRWFSSLRSQILARLRA